MKAELVKIEDTEIVSVVDDNGAEVMMFSGVVYDGKRQLTMISDMCVSLHPELHHAIANMIRSVKAKHAHKMGTDPVYRANFLRYYRGSRS